MEREAAGARRDEGAVDVADTADEVTEEEEDLEEEWRCRGPAGAGGLVPMVPIMVGVVPVAGWTCPSMPGWGTTKGGYASPLGWCGLGSIDSDRAIYRKRCLGDLLSRWSG